MSLDTSTKVCSIALHENGQLIGQQSYHLQKSHSSLLPAIINELMLNCESSLDQLSAIALSSGPGSYTGLRIGTATVKGLAFTLNIPLIAISTLDTMIAQVQNVSPTQAYFCPMIDARRMEVYCKIVKSSGEELLSTTALVVDEHSFNEYLDMTLILFGNGAPKLKPILTHENFHFVDHIHPSAAHMGFLAFQKFENKQFEDLAYFEPDYLKEYQSNTSPQKFTV